jgi:alpha-galactosidase
MGNSGLFKNKMCAVQLNAVAADFISYSANGNTYTLAAPVFEIDGVLVSGTAKFGAAAISKLSNGVMEYRSTGAMANGVKITLVMQVADDTPIVRFQYILSSNTSHTLTRVNGVDRLDYLSYSVANLPDVTEIRFSDFQELVHSYVLFEEKVEDRQFDNSFKLNGPMLVASDANGAFITAVEHGSQYPDPFITFNLTPDRTVTISAVKGNIFGGQVISPEKPFSTIWLQCGAAKNIDELAGHFRNFILNYQTVNMESRKPYIFYNTWAFQERDQAWGSGKYLNAMIQDRVMAEIDVAHKMGIDVFVLDTGWYEKTGDWRVNLKRFPDNLKSVKAKLDGYGMKLGLWFGPLHAAMSSVMHANHTDCIMSWEGKQSGIHPIWETEESQNLCLVSRYKDAFADELIKLVDELGVTYFKWDAIGQYWCDDPGHDHGDANCTVKERADSYAFQLGTAMQYVVNKLCKACPQAIVDFDITEGWRSVGLGFLSAGKYFLINNGPYYGSFNIPEWVRNQSNVFIWPGPARTWVCRYPLRMDKWIPSVLFLTHYLPDDPENSQILNIASLILGQNGIWGDLLGISDEGVARFGDYLAKYKLVRDNITSAQVVTSGMVSGSPEIYEKLADNGRGAVCVFATAHGKFSYVTQHTADKKWWATEGVTVSYDMKGRAVIEADFTTGGAKIIYFGV